MDDLGLRGLFAKVETDAYEYIAGKVYHGSEPALRGRILPV